MVLTEHQNLISLVKEKEIFLPLSKAQELHEKSKVHTTPFWLPNENDMS